MAISPKRLIKSLPGYDPFHGADDYEFLPERAAPYIALCQTYIRHIEGKVAGKPYLLEPHELAIFYLVFGWYHRETGLRRFREVLLYYPRKNSKSTFAAALMLCILFVDDEARMQCFSCGADRDQASIIRNIATRMVQNEPELETRVKIYHTTRAIELLADGSIYRALTADAHTKHGLNAHAVVCDEIHAYPNSQLIDVMKTSMGARENPLMVYTTTADFTRESACNQIHAYAVNVRDHVLDDPTFLPVIYELTKAEMDADPDCWKDPKVWARVNPLLGKSVSLEFLTKECKRAVADPSFENTFKRLYLNYQTETSERMISSEAWADCDGALDFTGRLVVGAGFDLAAVSDMCSFCLVFARPGGGYDAKWWHWLPHAAAQRMEQKRQIPFSVWEREGWVEITPGNEIDYDYVEFRVNDIGAEFPVKTLAVDRLFQGAQICQRLMQTGWNIEQFACSFYNMTAPTAELLRLVNRGEFGHGNNPVMRWQASNAILTRNAQDNMKPGKAESDGKIDGIVALVMAIAIAAQQKLKQGSVYDTRGPLVLGAKEQ